MTDPVTHRTTIAFIEALRELLREQLPHLAHDVLEVQVHSLTRQDRVLSVFVPRQVTAPADATPPPATRTGPVLNEMEANILEALGEAEMTGEEIAARAGYEADSVFRQTLAGLRRRGILTGRPGERGYRAASPSPASG